MPSKSILEPDTIDDLGGDHAARRILDSDQVRSEEPTSEEIATLAYELWVERGSPHGSHEEDWHRAEEQLRERHQPMKSSAHA